MQTEGNANHFARIGINFGITVVCIFPTWIVLSELDRNHEIQPAPETPETEIESQTSGIGK